MGLEMHTTSEVMEVRGSRVVDPWLDGDGL